MLIKDASSATELTNLLSLLNIERGSIMAAAFVRIAL